MLARATAVGVVAMLCIAVVKAAAGEGREHDLAQRTNAASSVAGWAYGIDPALLRTIAKAESSGDVSALSPKGALGLMQLMPATAARFGVRDSLDPVESIVGAARFLSYLRRVERNDGSIGDHLPQLLAAYNAGEDVVRRYGGIPPYRETREYVQRVLWLYLTGAMPPMAADPIRPDSQVLRVRAVRPPGDEDLGLLRQLARLRLERAKAQGVSAP